MKTIRQLVSFLLGVAVGVCLYSLLRLRPLSPGRGPYSAAQTGENRPNQGLRPTWVQRSLACPVKAPVRLHLARHRHALSSTLANAQLPARPVHARLETVAFVAPKTTAPEESKKAVEAPVVAQISAPAAPTVPAAAVQHKTVVSSVPAIPVPAPVVAAARVPAVPNLAPVNASAPSKAPVLAAIAPKAPVATALLSTLPPVVALAPPPPTIFKAIGYVEKADGQLEAIILQENQIQVVHIGDRIADRYRVTRITPDVVGAIDETLLQVPMAKPGGVTTKSDVLVASGVVSTSAASAGASTASAVAAAVPEQVNAPAKSGREEMVASSPVETASNSLGYVEKSDGKVEAIVADGDSVKLVPQAQTETLAQAAPPAEHHEAIAILTQANPAVEHHFAAQTVQIVSAGAAVQTVLTASAHAAAQPVQIASASTVAQPVSVIPPVTEASASTGSTVSQPEQSGGQDVQSAFRQVSYQVSTAADSSANSPSSETINDDFAAAESPMQQQSRKTSMADPRGSVEKISKISVELKPIGYVEKGNGELDAILSQDDEVYVVRKGDRFAGHLRAVSVSADAVEAVEDPPRHALPLPFDSPPPMPDLLSASVQQGPLTFAPEGCLECNSEAQVSASASSGGKVTVSVADHGRKPNSHSRAAASDLAPSTATFIFQTLGYVESQDGQVQAIVAEGSETYLVKQGETFADRYQATSVDPILVLAVRVSPSKPAPDFLSAQAVSSARSASKKLYGYLHVPALGEAGSSRGDGNGQDRQAASGLANAHAFHMVDALGSPVLADLGVDLFSASSTGFDLK